MHWARATLAALLLDGTMLSAFADVYNEKPWYGDLMDFLLFLLFVQMAECAIYGACS